MPKAFGLLHVYEPDSETPVIADIVFVHGLFGDRKETWTKHLPGKPSKGDSSGTDNVRLGPLQNLFFWYKPQSIEIEGSNAGASSSSSPQNVHAAQNVGQASEIFWPRDLLPLEIPNCRILSWGYDVDIDHVLSSASTATIFNHAHNLLAALTDARMEGQSRTRPLIFIAHSLGGIIVKDALNESLAAQNHLQEIAPSTFGICFLGTPHRGSPTAGLGEIIFRISELWGKSPNLQVLRSLKYDAETLDRIHSKFKQTLNSDKCKIRLRTFREARELNGFIIVDRFSSIIEDVQEVVSDIDSDHRNMTKFVGPEDSGFVSVSRALRRWIVDMKDIQDRYSRSLEFIGKNLMKELRNDEIQSRYFQIESASTRTFSWIFDEKVSFTNWLSDSVSTMNPIFWIQGKPGSGKSTMMKYIFENEDTPKLLNLRTKEDWIRISFFAHDRGSSIQKTLGGLLQEILYQLCSKESSSLDIVVNRYLQHNNSRPSIQTELDSDTFVKEASVISQYWTLDNLLSTILAVLNSPRRLANIIFFIDGLDEFNNSHRHIYETFQKLIADESTRRAKIKICLASRPEPLFKMAFGSCPGLSIHEYTRTDIRLYADQRMASTLLGSDDEPDARSELEHLTSEITEKANGVFIWVRLVVDELIDSFSDGCSISKLREFLSHIPEELEDLYKRIIARRKRSYAYESYVMIQVLLRAPKWLDIKTINAIADAVVLNRIEEMSPQSMKRRLASRCGGLIETIEATNQVQFLHQTAKTFFGKPTNIESLFKNRIEQPLEDGLVFLLKFAVHIASKEPISKAETYMFALRDLSIYAGQIETILEMSTVDLLDRLLEPRATFNSLDNETQDMTTSRHALYDGLAVWIHYADLDNLRLEVVRSHDVPRASKLLAIATSFGLVQYVKSKFATGTPLEIKGSPYPLLHCALIAAVDSVLELNISGQIPELIHFLLSQGADPNAISSDGFSALGRLIYHVDSFFIDSDKILFNTYKCLKILLNGGADPSFQYRLKGRSKPTLNHLLSSWKRFGWAGALPFGDWMLQTLLDHGADPNKRDQSGFTPLFFAILYGGRSATKLLLEHGADTTDIGDGIDALRPETYPEYLEIAGEMQKILQAHAKRSRAAFESSSLSAETHVFSRTFRRVWRALSSR